MHSIVPSTTDLVTTPPATPARRTWSHLPLPAAIIISAAAGSGLDLAYPDVGWWPMLFPSIILGLWTLRGRSLPTAFLVAFVFGGSFYFTHLAWVSTFLGALPWVALSTLEATLFGAGGVLITLAYRWSTPEASHHHRSLCAVPALVAAVWVTREVVMGAVPYTGFPWARTGMALVDSPLANAVSWTGVPGLSFLAVFACASILEGLTCLRWSRIVPSVTVLLVAAAVPPYPTTPAGSLTIGWVQGNGPNAYFDDAEPGEILRAQAAATAPLGGKRMDVVVWPEGSVDSDPLREARTAGVLNRVVEDTGAPVLVNAATTRGGADFNTSILWTGDDSPQLHDKSHPVPFGEYVPDRWLYERLAPDLIALIQREYTPGQNPPIMSLAGTTVGLAICFDVIYDDVIRDSATRDVGAYVFQTNNADFRGTDENLQQVAFARMRALETGRTVVNVSTTGTSQAIGKDGTIIDAIGPDRAGARVTEVPLYTGITFAVRIGEMLTSTITTGTVLALSCLLLLRLRQRRNRAVHKRNLT